MDVKTRIPAEDPARKDDPTIPDHAIRQMAKILLRKMQAEQASGKGNSAE